MDSIQLRSHCTVRHYFLIFILSFIFPSASLHSHRMHTQGSTAPTSNLSAFNLSGQNLDKFREGLAKLQPIFELFDAAAGALPALSEEQATLLSTELSTILSNTLNAVSVLSISYSQFAHSRFLSLPTALMTHNLSSKFSNCSSALSESLSLSSAPISMAPTSWSPLLSSRWLDS